MMMILFAAALPGMAEDPMTQAKLLKQEIYRAFEARSYPGDDHLGVYDYGEGEYVNEFFKGKRWQDVHLDDLLQQYPSDPSACMSFMTPEAFRYYLPAFLIMTVDNELDADLIPDSTVYKLLPPKENVQLREWFQTRMEGFSFPERQAITSLLRYYQNALEDYFDELAADIDEALEHYWDRPPER